MAAHLIAVTGSANLNEAQATKSLAARLPDDWIVFANISPQFVPARKGSRASEVDCLILGKRTTAIVDLKGHSGKVVAFSGRPWTLNGEEFKNRNEQPVAANKQHGFYASLEKRSYDFKDLFNGAGFDTFVNARVVFSAPDVSILNPANALLASTLDDFAAELVKGDAGRRKVLSRDMIRFALSHFTEGDEGRWPAAYRAEEAPNGPQGDPNADDYVNRLKLENAKLERTVALQEGEISRLKEELIELQSNPKPNADSAHAQTDRGRFSKLGEQKEKAFLLAEEIAVSKMYDKDDLYYRNSPKELRERLGAISLMDEPNTMSMLKYYAFKHTDYLLNGKGSFDSDSEFVKNRALAASFEMIKVALFLVITASFSILTYEAPAGGADYNITMFFLFCTSIIILPSCVIFFKSEILSELPKYSYDTKNLGFVHYAADKYEAVLIFSFLPPFFMVIGFFSASDREWQLLVRYFRGWSIIDFFGYVVVSATLLWILTKKSRASETVDCP